MYTDAVNLHELSNKVQSDLGGQNIEVWCYMIEQHSSNGAVVTGSAIYTQQEDRTLMEGCISFCILGSHKMKGTTHALTCIDSLPTAIRREIPYTRVNKRNSLLGAYWLLSACFFPGFAPG